MSDQIVIDASAALKWVLDEEHSDRAHALLSDALERHTMLSAPPLLAGEAANAIYQQQRR